MCTDFFTKSCFNATYPMVSLTGESLVYFYRDFCHDFNIPEHMMFGGYYSQAGRNNLFMKMVRKYDTQYHVSSNCRTNENPS